MRHLYTTSALVQYSAAALVPNNIAAFAQHECSTALQYLNNTAFLQGENRDTGKGGRYTHWKVSNHSRMIETTVMQQLHYRRLHHQTNSGKFGSMKHPNIPCTVGSKQLPTTSSLYRALTSVGSDKPPLSAMQHTCTCERLCMQHEQALLPAQMSRVHKARNTKQDVQPMTGWRGDATWFAPKLPNVRCATCAIPRAKAWYSAKVVLSSTEAGYSAKP